MTEAQLASLSPSKKSVSTAEVAVGALIMTGRVLALMMAFFLTLNVVQSRPSLLEIVQPLSIAAVMLIAAFARRGRATLLVLGYIVAFVIFVLLRPLADEAFVPVSYTYPIVFDRVLFLGGLPMVWLQDVFYVQGRVGALDVLLSGVYVTYFVAPHLAAVVVWRTRPELFPKALAGITLTFLVGLFFYFAVPTAPPWLASDRGDVDAEVVRILPEVSAQLAGETYDEASRAVGVNDVAAMPSLHTALTAMVALIVASYGRFWRRVGMAYLALMAFALVYLGEHYVIDEIAGIALALGIWKLVSSHRAFAWVRGSDSSEDAEPAETRRAA